MPKPPTGAAGPCSPLSVAVKAQLESLLTSVSVIHK